MSYHHFIHPNPAVRPSTPPHSLSYRQQVQAMAEPAPTYRCMQTPFLPSPNHRIPQLPARPRSYNGRFLPEVDFSTKRCGWCNTQSTSQWRVGCTTGSEAMKTLCNACGINYRRTQRKLPNLILDLDALAQHNIKRLSILKEFKRQNKLSLPLERSRRKPHKLIHRARPRPSTINMLLSDTAPLLSRQPPTAPTQSLNTIPVSRIPNVSCVPSLQSVQSQYLLVQPLPHPITKLPSFKEFTRHLTQMNLI